MRPSPARYLVTGATGLIGKRLLPLLWERRASIDLLIRPSTRTQHSALIESFAAQASAWGATVQAIEGDLGNADFQLEHARYDHVFHLAGFYDLRASTDRLLEVNHGGTERLLGALQRGEFRGLFHHISSIAICGDFDGTFKESMFDEGQHHVHPYHRSKFLAERAVRKQTEIPYRIYRPGAVVGHSQTGEMDRIDGPYYLIRAIHLLRRWLPRWMPLPRYDVGPLHMVPVDYVAAALDHLAHIPSGDAASTFHIVDPDPPSFPQTFNLLADAAEAPQMSDLGPGELKRLLPGGEMLLEQLQSVRFMRAELMEDLEIPPSVIDAVNPALRLDSAQTEAALQSTSIRCPRPEQYVDVLWSYYRRHLDPDKAPDALRSRHLREKRILITGASSGIGAALAVQCAQAGASVILVARREEALRSVAKEIQRQGGEAEYIVADLSDLDACDRVVERLEAAPPDILVNNAGHSIRRPLAESLERFDDLQRLMQINYFAPARLIRGFLPKMRTDRAGHIVNILSAGAQMPSPRFGAYTASKAALAQLGDTLAAELLSENIHVTGVFLPWVRTPMIEATGRYKDLDAMSPQTAAGWIIEGIIHKRRRVIGGPFARRYLLHQTTPKMFSRVINLIYRIYADDPQEHPELELDRALAQRWFKGRPI